MRLRLSIISTVLLGLIWFGASCTYLASRKMATGPEVAGNEVVFRFYAPSAFRVQVAGDWAENNWSKGDGSIGEANVGLMSDDDGDGVWEIKVKLEPGKYRYLFFVDENSWHLDPGNPEEVPGGPEGICSQIVLVLRQGHLELR